MDSFVFSLETGSAITSSFMGLGSSLTPPAGQAGKPVPGYNGKYGAAADRNVSSVLIFCVFFIFFLVTVIDDQMEEVKPRTLGNIVVS